MESNPCGPPSPDPVIERNGRLGAMKALGCRFDIDPGMHRKNETNLVSALESVTADHCPDLCKQGVECGISGAWRLVLP